MKPYIFLTENCLTHTVDSYNNAVDLRNLSASTPFTQVLYFTDLYGNIVNRTIDTLILRNTNIANMTVEYAVQEDESESWESESDSESGDYPGITYLPLVTLTGNTDSTVFLKASTPVVTSSIRITIPDITNPEIVNAQMGVYGFICNLLALTDSNYKIEANQGSYRVVSGAYIHWADYKKWVGKVKMENLPKSQFDLLTAQADTGEMTVVPYQDLELDEVYECGVNREYQYEVDRKTELFSLELELNEL